MIKKRCDMHGIKITVFKINSIIITKGKKNLRSLLSTLKKGSKRTSEKVCTVSNLFKRKTLTRENPQTQKSTSKSLNTPAATINKIIN